MTDRQRIPSGMPPALIGLTEVEWAARLALAVFDDDRARYDAVLDPLDPSVRTSAYPLIWMLVRNWVQSLVELHDGPDDARKDVERTLAGVIELWDEALGNP